MQEIIKAWLATGEKVVSTVLSGLAKVGGLMIQSYQHDRSTDEGFYSK